MCVLSLNLFYFLERTAPSLVEPWSGGGAITTGRCGCPGVLVGAVGPSTTHSHTRFACFVVQRGELSTAPNDGSAKSQPAALT